MQQRYQGALEMQTGKDICSCLDGRPVMDTLWASFTGLVCWRLVPWPHPGAWWNTEARGSPDFPQRSLNKRSIWGTPTLAVCWILSHSLPHYPIFQAREQLREVK